ncbi:hypothetical protein F4821DRAFT_235971 [Hypoxylon rubiginosum]|uniref:Uncharacterized protein n=1 Tax=Hypoxylon rubiginosum TaxID=110542 RepID=A0ACC0D4L4_9PEZI|nr:hypothetical protein F4821DRAFT_235971 [Hypoxylon rubiginosum]
MRPLLSCPLRVGWPAIRWYLGFPPPPLFPRRCGVLSASTRRRVSRILQALSGVPANIAGTCAICDDNWPARKGEGRRILLCYPVQPSLSLEREEKNVASTSPALQPHQTLRHSNFPSDISIRTPSPAIVSVLQRACFYLEDRRSVSYTWLASAEMRQRPRRIHACTPYLLHSYL